MEKRILLVDDNKDFAVVFETRFRHLGKISLALSYAEALPFIEAGGLDLFILDHNLDQNNCFDLIPQIRAKNPRAHIIILTGYADKEMAIRAVNAGVSGLLEKPLNEEALYRRLSEIGWFESRLTLDERNRSLVIDGVHIALTKVELQILRTLMERRKQLVTRAELEECIWGGRHIVKNSLDTHLYNLKRKVPVLKSCLASIHGSGYILDI